MNQNWYKSSYRRTLLDMHIEDWDDKFLSLYNPDEYIKMLKKAHVQSVMIYANSHVGCCYWPTKSDYVHKGIGNRDLLGETIELAHMSGMDAILYYSLIFNNRAYEQNPEWRIRDVKGRGSRKTISEEGFIGRYGICCPNSVGYRGFVNAQVSELCSLYDFEGFFFDMTFWPEICYCDSCRMRFKRETGWELPQIVNWDNERWVKFQQKREEWLVEFAAFASGLIREQKNGVTVEHNSATITHNWINGTSSGLVAQNSYLGGDLYGGFIQQSFICKLYQALTPDRPFEYMTSRCYPKLSEHTNIKPEAMLEVHNCLTLAHDGAFLFIDAIDPIGTITPEVYKIIGNLFERTAVYEPYIGGEICVDIGIYYSFHSRFEYEDNGKSVDAALSDKSTHMDAVIGASQKLKESHMPFGVLTEVNLNDINKYQVVILPCAYSLTEEEIFCLKEYLSEGGRIYASGYTDFRFLKDVFGVTIDGYTKQKYTYIVPAEDKQHLMSGITQQSPLGIPDSQVIASVDDTSGIQAYIMLPYTDPDDSIIFASIHSNPPGCKNQSPAIICKNYGKGKAVWVSVPLESYRYAEHKRAFEKIIGSLVLKPLHFEVDGPGEVEVVLLHQHESSRYIISVINEQETFPQIPIHDIRINILMDGKKPLRAILLPEKKILDIVKKGNLAIISLPRLDIMHMIELEYEVERSV